MRRWCVCSIFFILRACCCCSLSHPALGVRSLDRAVCVGVPSAHANTRVEGNGRIAKKK